MSFTVYKCNHQGEVELSYQGQVRAFADDFICITATFMLPTRDLGYIVLRTGDQFTEWFYPDRWYNVFRVDDVDTGELKGFYCNFTRPAHISEESVYADDLALDLFVYPDGKTVLLDEAEYHALPLSPEEREQVELAQADLLQRINARQIPFEGVGLESDS